MKISLVSIIGMALTAVGGIVTTIGSEIEKNKTIAEEVAKAVSKATTK